MPTPSTDDIKRWMYFNCSRYHNWVIYQNLDAILKDSIYTPSTAPKIESRDDLTYIHSTHFTTDHLTAILETTHGFYVLDNHKTPEKVESRVSYCSYDDLPTLIKNMTNKLRETLNIKKLHSQKLTQNQRTRSLLPYDFHPQQSIQQQIELLNKYQSEKSHLDLSDVTGLTTSTLKEWNPSHMIRELTLNSCYQIREFEWLQTTWVQNIKKLTLINMTHITNASLEYLTHNLSQLEELYVFSCPQVNIKCLLTTLNIDRLQVLCLNDPNMACQPNEYSGLITETEWGKFRNRSLKKLLINSNNISVDIIDYLRKSLKGLTTLILNPVKYKYFKESLINQGTSSSREITVASTENKAVKLKSDFVLKNLLKHRYQAPFSKSMLKVMERIRAEEFKEDEAQPQCPVDIHKTN